MDYLKRFLFNLVFLVVMFAIVCIAFSSITKLAYQATGGFFVPLVISYIIIAALPKRRKQKYIQKTNSKPGNMAGESTNKLADKRYINLLIYGFVGFVFFVLLAVTINNTKAWGISGIGTLILLILLKTLPDYFFRQVDKKTKEVNRARKGAEAEKRIDGIFENLSDQYYVINDVVSNFGNIDHVIIKRDAGVFLVETKSHHGKVSFSDKSILLNDHPTEKDFIAQTLSNVYWLREKINPIINYNVWIYPIIVFTNAFVPFAPPIRGIHMVNIKFLLNTFEKLNNEHPINQRVWEKREAIYTALKGNQILDK